MARQRMIASTLDLVKGPMQGEGILVSLVHGLDATCQTTIAVSE